MKKIVVLLAGISLLGVLGLCAQSAPVQAKTKTSKAYKVKLSSIGFDVDSYGDATISGQTKKNVTVKLIPDSRGKEDGFTTQTTKSDELGKFSFDVTVTHEEINEEFYVQASSGKTKGKKVSTVITNLNDSDESKPAVDTNSASASSSSSTTATKVSREYKNAVSSANDYLDFTAMSQSGLKDQLVHDGYPDDAAQYAIDNIEVDWNDQALKSAEDYLDTDSMSNQELQEQLVYDGFTDDQAAYAISNLPA